MPTDYTERLFIIIPDARKTVVTNWWVANVDPAGANTFSVGLSASGQLPATHWAACVAFPRVNLRKVLVRLATMAGIANPDGWENWTQVQRVQWIADNRTTIQNATGIRIWRSDNEAGWDDYRGLITAAGLKFI